MKINSQQVPYRYCNHRPVIITGMGIVSSIGIGLEEFTTALKTGKSGLQEIEGFVTAQVKEEMLDSIFAEHYAERLSKKKRSFKQSIKSVKGSVLAALQAWEQAGLFQQEIEKKRVGIVVAGSNISNLYIYDTMKKNQESLEYLHPRYALNFMDTCHIGAVSEFLDIHGAAFTVGGASASGNVAILRAAELIQLGMLDICLCIGAMTEFSPLERQAFKTLGAFGGKSFLDCPEKASRPFDMRHEGFILGQASACLILEGQDNAENRGAEELAVLVGGAQSSDGTMLSDPNLEGEIGSMLQAIESAGIEASSIDYVNAHGTSTPLGDKTELEAIKKVFGEEWKKPWINSTKCMTGHCLFSAGVVEAIATVIQLQKGFIHPMINLENPLEEGFHFTRAVCEYDSIVYALSNSYGFTGINTSIVLKKEEENAGRN